MPRVITAMAFLIGICAVLIVVAVGVGRAVAAEPDLTALALCDGEPCVLGIAPGRLSWSDLSARLTDLPGASVRDMMIDVALPGGGSVRITPSFDRHTINVIRVWPNDTLSVGSLVLRLGPPCAVGVLKMGGDFAMTLVYPRTFIAVDRRSGHLATRARLWTISLFAEASNRSVPDIRCSDAVTQSVGAVYVVRPWRGFASARHYYGVGVRLR